LILDESIAGDGMSTAQSLTQDPPSETVPEGGGIAESPCDSGSVFIKQVIGPSDVRLYRDLIDGCMHKIMSSDTDWYEILDRTALVNFIKTCGNFKLISGNVLGFPLHDIVGRGGGDRRVGGSVRPGRDRRLYCAR